MGSCTSSSRNVPGTNVPAQAKETGLLNTKQSLAANSRVGPTHPAAYEAFGNEPRGEMKYPIGLGAGSGLGLGLGGGYGASVNTSGGGFSGGDTGGPEGKGVLNGVKV